MATIAGKFLRSKFGKVATSLLGGVLGSALLPGLGTKLGSSIGGAIGSLVSKFANSGAGKFVGGLVGAGLGSGVSSESSPITNWLKGASGSGLTQSQIESNSFSAAQAQANRDFEERMSSTAYQRGTSDMIAAGLNPAMMYGGSASPASTPSGSAASASSSDISGGLLNSLLEVGFASARLRGLRLDNENKQKEGALIDAQTDYYGQQTSVGQSVVRLNDKTVSKLQSDIEVNTHRVNALIASANLDEQKANEVQKALAWYDDNMRSLLALRDSQASVYDAQIKEIAQRVENLKAERSEIFERVAKLAQDINESMSREFLNYSYDNESGTRQDINIKQLEVMGATIDKYHAERDKLVLESGVLSRDIDYYFFNRVFMPTLRTAGELAGDLAPQFSKSPTTVTTTTKGTFGRQGQFIPQSGTKTVVNRK